MDKTQGYLKKKEFALDVLDNDLFHIVKQNTKDLLSGYMTNQILQTSFAERTDDRDSYINKRIDLAGVY